MGTGAVTLLHFPDSRNEGELIRHRDGVHSNAIVGAITMNTTFELSVNYGLSVEEMIQAGNYGGSENFLSHFGNVKHWPNTPKEGVHEVKTEVIHLSDRMALTPEMELGRRGFRPANVFELLTFGTKYPEVQIKCKGCGRLGILALGTKFHKGWGLRVASLSTFLEDNRRLFASDTQMDPCGQYYFLVVRDEALKRYWEEQWKNGPYGTFELE